MMDIANTGVARGKIYLARQRREAIPEGWALNEDGEPTIGAQAAIDGIILPMAGHKGYAIAVVVDMLSGVLSGSEFLSAVNGPYKAGLKSGAGHFFTAFHIDAFQPLADFIRACRDSSRSSRPCRLPKEPRKSSTLGRWKRAAMRP